MAGTDGGFDGGRESGDTHDGESPRRARPDVFIARLGDRVVARLIDGLIVGVPVAVLWVVGVAATNGTEEPSGAAVRVLIAVSLVASALYEIPMTALKGQTVGKRLRHLRVARLSDGKLPGWNASIARWFTMNAVNVLGLFVASQLSSLYTAVDLGLGLRRPLRQCLHDLTAGTVVISDR